MNDIQYKQSISKRIQNFATKNSRRIATPYDKIPRVPILEPNAFTFIQQLLD